MLIVYIHMTEMRELISGLLSGMLSTLCVFVCLSSLMQRRYSEPNTYIDTISSISHNSDELYDDVASIADPEVSCRET